MYLLSQKTKFRALDFESFALGLLWSFEIKPTCTIAQVACVWIRESSLVGPSLDTL